MYGNMADALRDKSLQRYCSDYLESREKVELCTALYLTHQGSDELLSGLSVRVDGGQTAATGRETVDQVVSVAPPPLHVGVLQVVLQVLANDPVVVTGVARGRARVVAPSVTTPKFSDFIFICVQDSHKYIN